MPPHNLPTLADLHLAHSKQAQQPLLPEQIAALKQQVYDVLGACMEVHKHMGPFLNEYMYQDALEFEFQDRGMHPEREYYFRAEYKGRVITHKHYCDFMVPTDFGPVILECKAVDRITDEHRQQLWNYMRLTKTRVGVLYNFAPVRSQCEKYYIDPDNPINRYVF